MASVRVAVRVRPFNKRELAMNAKLIIQMDGKRTRIFNTKPPGSGRDIDGEKYKDFTFDHSYWSYDSEDENYASQEEVFYDLGTDVIESAFSGYNACVFAYGQTGSGKTFTMMGTPESQGLIPRICKTLFARMAAGKEGGASYRTEVSFLEIHNERVRDLLRPDQSQSHSLRVREHPKRGPYVQDLSNHLVYDYSDIQECMVRGNTHRTTASTNMNDVSSRSHAIFTITFVQAGFSGNMPSETVSKVHLVDLAGSERADATGATGQRLKEGAHINKSLVTLGSVISALAEVSSSSCTSDSNSKRNVFIPYRDSVLTWLLKDSLGGNSKTIMIAAVSPADCNYGETLSTLRYANRAKNIINKPTINEDANVKLIRELREEIQKLKSLIDKDASVERPPQVLLAQIHEKQEQEKVLTEEWAEKWRETQLILQEQRALGLRKSGVGVVLDSEMPHLVGIDDDLLSTGVTLYHLKEGKTLIGSEDATTPQDIVLSGVDVEPEHCVVELNEGIATLHPLSAHCWINTAQVDKATRLSQGCIILLGRNNMFRYNDPAEAAKLRKEGGIGNGNLQSVVNLSRLSLLSWSVSDLHTSSSNDNLLNSSEDLGAIEELEHQKALLLKEKEDFKREQEEREERWAARREALEGAQRELEREWGAQWREWAEALAQLEARQQDLRSRRNALEQERRDEMTQVESVCREVSSLRTILQSKQRQFDEFMHTQNRVSNDRQQKKTGDGVSSDISTPESWSSLNDADSAHAVRELVNNHRKELTTLENELQDKVKSLNEHRRKVDSIDVELFDVADKHQKILNLELESGEVSEKKLFLAKRTQEQLQEIMNRKQSLSLDLKRVGPSSSCNDSVNGDEVTSQSDLKSLQDECNRKLKIASAVNLLYNHDPPLSAETTDTFHTAAADSPEFLKGFREDEEQNEEAENKTKSEYVTAKEDCGPGTSTGPDPSPDIEHSEKVLQDDVKKSMKEDEHSLDEKVQDTSEFRDKEDNNLLSESISTESLTIHESPQHQTLRRLQQRIARQKMIIMRLLEINAPCKEDLNRQIGVLQDLQRQQIELEALLIEKKDSNHDTGRNERRIPAIDQDPYMRVVNSQENFGQNSILTEKNSFSNSNDFQSQQSSVSEISQQPTLMRNSPSQTYTSVYLTQSRDRSDHLSSPYSLTITRSLPSLIANESENENVINMIVSVPSYIVRGAGASSHYEYEVRVAARDDSWTLLRRYRRFRELNIMMRQKYGAKIGTIPFPPRQFFKKSEAIARQRRKQLEIYLRRLIQVCAELPLCQPLYKYNTDLSQIDKQSLLEFSVFFRRGTFESSKYGTS
ncbi:kinesin-like protein Klp98A isoform X1 [Diprion similis]|uniref:kinesin-like protein Klp98A isoform X1 n=1 Tax=Diprion similis TaxID=362088 RepID=UPI001EF83CC6|nr:kinesin-like protein Klp98A isoform X1 [Diprion similis]